MAKKSKTRLVREKLAAVSARIEKARAEIDSLEAEQHRLTTALEVLNELGSDDDDEEDDLDLGKQKATLSLTSRVMGIVSEVNVPLSLADVIARLEPGTFNPHTVAVTLSRFVRDKKLEKHGQNHYVLPGFDLV
jgi:hypothetical protein